MLRPLALLFLLLCAERAAAQSHELDAGLAPDAHEGVVPSSGAVRAEPDASAARVPASGPRTDAGPSKAPSRTAEQATTQLSELPPKRPLMRFAVAPDSHRRDLVLFVKKGAVPALGREVGHFEPLCRAPCRFHLRSGTHLFAVAHQADSLIELDRALYVERGQEVVVRYRARRAARRTGWVVLFATVAAGAALIALGQPQEGEAKIGMIVGGTLLGVLGLAGGLWLVNLPDRASGWVNP